MVGVWKVQFRHKKRGKLYDVKVQMKTAVDQGSGFPEIWGMKKKEYLCLQEVIHDNGGEFIGKEFQELLHSYRAKDMPTT
eukprot:6700647-Ditylum_brightwellii.AAC.1